jgi:glutaredoxin-related protein
MNERYAKLTLALTFSLLLAACATTRSAREAPLPAAAPAPGKSDTAAVDLKAAAEKPPELSRLYKGTGVLVAGQEEGGDVPPIARPPVQPGGSAVTLNFEAADIREVVRNILGDILNESYTIDPAVGGTVTIRTTSGIPRESLPATMEMLLRMNGATMTKERGIWKILPAAAAVRGNVTPQLGNSQRALSALRAAGAPVTVVDILPDPRFRQELSSLSGWPTIPQVFVKGELVGGADIVEELAATGELERKLTDALGESYRDERVEHVIALDAA